MKKKSAFTLMELLVVITIASILAGVGISGYMSTLRIERRQDAVLSLQKAWLIIQSTVAGSSPMCANSSSTYGDTNCLSDSGFYNITYNISGYTPPPSITSSSNFLLANELLILQAKAITGKGQDKDITPLDCSTIYLSNQNKMYPANCIK